MKRILKAIDIRIASLETKLSECIKENEKAILCGRLEGIKNIKKLILNRTK